MSIDAAYLPPMMQTEELQLLRAERRKLLDELYAGAPEPLATRIHIAALDLKIRQIEERPAKAIVTTHAANSTAA